MNEVETLEKENKELRTRLKKAEELLALIKSEPAELQAGKNLKNISTKSAEDVVKERHRLYSVLETIPAYVVLLTKDYHVLFANQYFEERFGKSSGRCCYDYLFNRTSPCENCETFKVFTNNLPHHWEWTGPDKRDYDVFDFPFTDSDHSPLVMEMGIDITEQKKAQDELKRINENLERIVDERTKEIKDSQKKLSNVYSSMIEGLALYDIIYDDSGNAIDYYITEVNPAFKKITGLSDDKVLGNKASEIFGTSTAPFLDIYAHVCKSGIPKYFEEYFPPMNKSFAISVFSLGDGKFATVFSDITERKKSDELIKKTNAELEKRTADLIAANKSLSDSRKAALNLMEDSISDRNHAEKFSEELRRTSEYLENLFNYANAPIICWDASLEITRFNHAFEKMTGYSAPEVLGKKLDILFPEESKKKSLKEIENTLTLKWDVVEIPILRKDGKIRVALWNSANIFSADGKTIEATIAQGQDITERKKAENILREREENIRAIFNATSESIFMFDCEGNIVAANETAARRLKHSLDEIVGCPFSNFVPPELVQPRMDKVNEVLNSGKALQFEDERDGMIFYHSFYPVFENEKPVRVVSYSQDITKKKKTENALRESELRFRLALKNAPISIAMQDINLKYIWIYNPHTIEANDAVGKTDSEIFHPEDAERLNALKKRVINTGEEVRDNLWIESGGRQFYFDVFIEPIKNESGEITGVGIVSIDLTQMKLAEQQIEHLASFPRLNPIPIVETDLNGRIKYYNDAAINSLKELDSAGELNLFFPNDFQEILKLVYETDEVRHLTRELNIKERIFEETINYSKENNFVRLYAFDITNRRLAEEELRKLWRAIEHSPNSIIITDNNGNIEYVNPKFCDVTGYSFNEALGKKPSILKSGKTEQEIYKSLWKKIKSGIEYRGELLNKKKNGELFWESINISPVRNAEGEITHFVAIKEDITERRKSEEKLYRLNRTLNALRHISDTIVRANDEQEFMNEICRLIIDDCGHEMVWIGFAENDEQKTVRPVASAGLENGYLQTLNITWADTERGKGPTGTAIRTGKPSSCNNMLIDANFKPWKTEAIKRGFASSLVLPLKNNGNIFGAITIYSKEPDSFFEDEINLLSELSENLAYGISVIRLRAAHRIAEEELLKHRDQLEELIKVRTSELELTNEILKGAQEAAHIGHWYLNLVNGRIIWSDEVYKILGVKSKKTEPSREEFSIFIYPEDRDFVEKEFDYSLENKIPYNLDFKIIRPDGIVRDVHEQFTIYKDQTGEAVYILGAIQDITEFKKTEKELAIHKNNLEELVRKRTEELALSNRQLKEEIEKEKQVEMLLQNSLEKEKELNELKSRFISTTSHEFRTPLTSVLSSMQLIQRYRKKWSDEKLEDQFERIKNSIFNLTGLLDDILTISHADSGRIIFNPQEIDLRQLCLELIEEVKHKATKNHLFVLNYSCKKLNFLLDPKLIRFILINLLSNACKYSPKGGKIILSVSTRQDEITISVSDEGIGIPEEERKYLFKPFFRAKNTGEIEGTGLGLSIVQRSVEMHNGNVKYHPNKGKGTIFTVKIPEAHK